MIHRALLLLALLAPLAEVSAAPAFTITTFNVAGGSPYTSSYPYGMNSAGTVIGLAETTSGYAPFLYSGGTATTLSTDFITSGAINDNGLIVGAVDSGPSRYNGDGTWTPLTTDPSATDVYGVNNSGVAVGQRYNDAASYHQALRYNADGSLTYLSGLTPDGTLGSCAAAINATGTIAGCADIDGLTTHAVRWAPDGTIEDLGTLPGGESYSAANGINAVGQIVGLSNTADATHAFIWTDGVFKDLGTPASAGFDTSEAFGINTLGHVVGSLDGPSSTRSAFYYDGTKMWDLASLVKGGLATAGLDYLYNATGINDADQIVGDAFDLDGNRVGFILTAVPEPGTWGLLIALPLALLILQRRTRRAKGPGKYFSDAPDAQLRRRASS